MTSKRIKMGPKKPNSEANSPQSQNLITASARQSNMTDKPHTQYIPTQISKPINTEDKLELATIINKSSLIIHNRSNQNPLACRPTGQGNWSNTTTTTSYINNTSPISALDAEDLNNLQENFLLVKHLTRGGMSSTGIHNATKILTF